MPVVREGGCPYFIGENSGIWSPMQMLKDAHASAGVRIEVHKSNLEPRRYLFVSFRHLHGECNLARTQKNDAPGLTRARGTRAGRSLFAGLVAHRVYDV